ncbi:MAG: M3 family peptidase, partial [Bryobacteraceae bacterium]
MSEQVLEDQAVASNPLLSERFPIPFNAITAEHVKPAVELLLKQMKQRVDDLGSPQTPRTYQDVLLALDSA